MHAVSRCLRCRVYFFPILLLLAVFIRCPGALSLCVKAAAIFTRRLCPVASPSPRVCWSPISTVLISPWRPRQTRDVPIPFRPNCITPPRTGKFRGSRRSGIWAWCRLRSCPVQREESDAKQRARRIPLIFTASSSSSSSVVEWYEWSVMRVCGHDLGGSLHCWAVERRVYLSAVSRATDYKLFTRRSNGCGPLNLTIDWRPRDASTTDRQCVLHSGPENYLTTYQATLDGYHPQKTVVFQVDPPKKAHQKHTSTEIQFCFFVPLLMKYFSVFKAF